MSEAYLGLGSNVGDRERNVMEAVRRLAFLPGSRPTRLSAMYDTEPVGPIEQGWFINRVVVLETTLEPAALLDGVKNIERAMGRESGERWGPRLIDIDLLLYDDLQIASNDLVIPHPELWNRRFVLVPLKDVLPPGDLLHRVEERLADLGEAPIVKKVTPPQEIRSNGL